MQGALSGTGPPEGVNPGAGKLTCPRQGGPEDGRLRISTPHTHAHTQPWPRVGSASPGNCLAARSSPEARLRPALRLHEARLRRGWRRRPVDRQPCLGWHDQHLPPVAQWSESIGSRWGGGTSCCSRKRAVSSSSDQKFHGVRFRKPTAFITRRLRSWISPKDLTTCPANW